MDLQTFVTETLRQLIEAVVVAQQHAKDKGARIAPKYSGTKTVGQHTLNEIEFDVAVTVTEAADKKGGLNVAFAGIGVGGSTASSSANLTVSRIKFCIPVGWPIDPPQKPSDSQSLPGTGR